MAVRNSSGAAYRAHETAGRLNLLHGLLIDEDAAENAEPPTPKAILKTAKIAENEPLERGKSGARH